MTVDTSPTGPILLTGDCALDDAELLLSALLARPDAVVDWAGCTSAHAAVVQVLLAIQPTMTGIPAGVDLGNWIQPLIRGRGIARA